MGDQSDAPEGLITTERVGASYPFQTNEDTPMFRASLIVAAAALPSMAFAQASNVDLNRFDGRWFEIERNHNNVQKDCSRAQIDFTPQGAADRYAITVTCTRRADGKVKRCAPTPASPTPRPMRSSDSV